MDRIALIHVPELEYLTVPVDDRARIRLKHLGDANYEVLETVDQIGVLVQRAIKRAVLDVHVLESRGVLRRLQFVIESFLHVSAFEAHDGDEAFEVAAKEHMVVHVPVVAVDVQLLTNNVLRSAHLRQQIHGGILIT